MIIIITTNSYYSDCHESLWSKLDSLPEGQLYHRVYTNDDGTDHFFSDEPITDKQIKDNYEG